MQRMRDAVRLVLAHPTERWSRRVIAMYALVFPGSLWAVAFDLVPPDGRWFGGVLLALQGTAALLWLWERIGKASIWPSGFVLVCSTLVEYIGATTEQPFGAYDYTAALGLRLFGVVPLVIPLAWVMVVYGSWCAVEILPVTLGRGGRALVAGLVVALFDIQIEPSAVHINQYWRWDVEGFYYGVPLQNFIAWCVVGMVFAFVTDPELVKSRSANTSKLPLLALAGSCVMFIVMNTRGGYWWASACSVLSLSVFGWFWWQARHQAATSSDTVAA